MNALETFKLAKETYKLCNEAYKSMNLPEQIKQMEESKTWGEDVASIDFSDIFQPIKTEIMTEEPKPEKKELTIEEFTQQRIDFLTNKISELEAEINEAKESKRKAEKALKALR